MQNYYDKNLEMLNQAQKDAVMFNQGPLFVIAGAGTGKTKTLTMRIAYLIKNLFVDPQRILAVTFTNKAAREIRERVNQMVVPQNMGSWLHTFHAFGLRLLREEAHHLKNYNVNFDVIDEDDSKKIIRELSKSHEIEVKKFPPKLIKNYISERKCLFEVERDETLETIYNAYQSYLQKQNIMDFDDLIMRTLEVLQTNNDVLRKYQNRFDYILVDEFQDTDKNQYEILKLLAMNHKQICVVGDPDQSIYSFRGANYANSMNFIKDFNATKIVLNENYRSTNKILNAANNLILYNHNRPSKKELQSSFGDGYDISYFKADNDRQEAYFVVEKIEELVRYGKYKYSDIAVLYRNNALSRIFEDAFIRASVKTVIYGGLSFYERKEVKDILAYIKVCLDPSKDVYLKRIINEPKRGIGDTTVNKLEAVANINGISMFEAIDLMSFSSSVNQKLLNFKELIKSISSEIDDLTEIKQIVDIVSEKSGYIEMLKNEADDIAKDRIENIKELKSIFASSHMFYQGDNREVLMQILDQIALYTDKDKNVDEDDAVILSTYHQVKGLEFKVVFMVVMEQGIFPSERAYLDPSEMEEERRIAYVGITRAQERLFITYAAQRLHYGQIKHQGLSKFVVEMQRGKLPTQTNTYNTQTHNYTRTSSVQKSDLDFNTGDKVKHSVFGEGIVVSKSNGILKIAFSMPHGIKELMDKHPSIKKIK